MALTCCCAGAPVSLHVSRRHIFLLVFIRQDDPVHKITILVTGLGQDQCPPGPGSQHRAGAFIVAGRRAAVLSQFVMAHFTSASDGYGGTSTQDPGDGRDRKRRTDRDHWASRMISRLA